MVEFIIGQSLIHRVQLLHVLGAGFNMTILFQTLSGYGEALFTYFLADDRKSGGAYVTAVGALKKIDPLERRIVLTDGTVIPIEDILEIESKSVEDCLSDRSEQ